jgi:CubicO group peptidase (beta-lactamase class C family)
MAVTVVKDEKIIYTKGFGYADWENLKPVTTESVFRWASMSKSLTALLAFKLQEEKLADLESSVSTYLPEYPYPMVKLKYLLQNRSGLGHYTEMTRLFPAWSKRLLSYPSRDTFNAKATVDIFREAPLDFQPGERFLYSTFGFILAGATLDQIGRNSLGVGYLGLVNELIRKPFGMTTLEPDYTFNNNPNEVSGYYLDSDCDIQTRKDDDISWKLSGGGFQSTIGDLGNYIVALMQRKLLKKESYEQIWSRQPDADYAYGFDVRGEGKDLRVGHAGSQNKTRTIFIFYPEKKIGVGVMCNSEWAEPELIALKVLKEMGIEPEEEKEYVRNCNTKNKSTYRYLGIWQEGEQHQMVRKGYGSRQFQAEVSHLSKFGYNLVDADAYLDKKNVRRWDAIFQHRAPTAQFIAHQNRDSFQLKVNAFAKTGWHLIDLETYIANNQRLWAGVVTQNEKKATLVTELEAEAFQKKYEELNRKNLRLIDFKTYWTGQKRLWAGVFTPGYDSHAFFRSLSQDAFFIKNTELNNQGLQLADIEIYTLNGREYWSGVWRQEKDLYEILRDTNYCTQERKGKAVAQRGMELVDWERY